MNKIYIIKNNINSKVYIGKTQYSIEQRFKEHCNDYLKREEEKRPLYDAMKKYGVENFYIELIEDNISDQEINEKEIFYIKQYNSYIGLENANGYNATLGGDGKKYKNWNLQEIIDLYNNGNSCAAIARQLNLDASYIRKILKNNGIEVISTQERAIKEQGKIVYQLDIDTNEIINKFDSVGQANIALGKDRRNGTIRDALRGRRGHHNAYGYKWSYSIPS